jgi:hypothetical protein
MAKPKKPKAPKPPKVRTRYSIGEWYGRGFETLSRGDRFRLANTEWELDALTGTPCPFQPMKCNKKGGVCSLRLYQQTKVPTIRTWGKKMGARKTRLEDETSTCE